MPNKMKKLTLIIILILSGYSTWSQMDPNITYWQDLRGVFNPASVGTNKGIDINILQREQWFGIENRPGTSILAAGAYIGKANSALSVTGFYDRFGFQRNANVRVNYAFHINLNEKTFLSAGVGVGFINTYTRISELSFANPNEPLLDNIAANRWQPDVSIGLEAVHPKYTIGVAVPHIIGGQGTKHPYWARMYVAYGTYNFQIKSVKLVPAVLIRTTLFKTQVEGNVTAHFLNDRIWAGLGYRMQDAASVLFGVNVGKGVKIGYAFDYTLSRMIKYNIGTHELMLSFRWKTPRKPTPSFLNPRDF